MSDSNQRAGNDANKNAGRNLPSWMSSRENENKSHGKKPANASVNEENNVQKLPRQAKGHDKPCSGSTASKKIDCNKKPSPSNLGAINFSELLEGVVFVLSGFVNPERSVLRSQALEMGAEYQPDWNSNCTLLVCAFTNTPKFRQVEADFGTIVSKEWISECYSQKKLVDIESYLMHAGKPWRRQNISHEASQVLESSASSKPRMQTDRGPRAKSITSVSAKREASNPAKERFSPSKVKKWAIDDFNRSISWLESLEDKPDASEIKKIAVEGILACLQDALDLLKQKQDILQMTKEWNFIPRAVGELMKLEGTANGSSFLSKEELCKEAMKCKQIYEAEIGGLGDDSMTMRKRPRTDESMNGDSGRHEAVVEDAGTYDSDETVEMTVGEIDLAYNTVASKLGK